MKISSKRLILFFWQINLCTFFFSCSGNETSPNIELAPSSQLVIIGQDLSKTFRSFDRIQSNQWKDFLGAFSTNGVGGSVYYISIGNPGKHSFNYCRIEEVSILAEKSFSRMISKREDNEKSIEKNKTEIFNFIEMYSSTKLNSVFDNYTDLEHFFQKVREIANEPRYQGFEKSVFLFSDGYHSIPKKEGMTSLSNNDFEGLNFYTCGLQNKALFGDINFLEVESPNAFFDNFIFKLKSEQK
ncbi:MAG: hypothetical protein P1U70_06210 [Saprospiraceae bacterium]|jgi:hypothetical protein|nr:hypothetical protein [Saprospiraceae bacterium]